MGLNFYREDPRSPVPTANPKRLTAPANRLIFAADERSLQVDLGTFQVSILARVGDDQRCSKPDGNDIYKKAVASP
jgi:hypothetical protein